MIAEQNRVPDGSTAVEVYVKGCARGELAGALHLVLEDRWSRFDSLLDLIAVYENWLDAGGYPQSTHQMRTIGGGGRLSKLRSKMSRENMEGQLSEKPTFVIQVHYRQNASWQGTVHWVEGEKVRHFRSTLELIHLMDDVIGAAQRTGWEEKDETESE
jgi:hypothetical protein